MSNRNTKNNTNTKGNKMSKLSISLLNAEECLALNERLLNVLQSDLKQDTVVNKVVPHLIDLSTNLSNLLSRAGNTSDITDQLAEKNKIRDDAFISFRDYCVVFTHVPVPKQVDAAEKLVALVRRIDWRLYAQGYTEQTSSQKSLLKALAEPEYAEAVTTINATNWINYMKTSNDDFERVLALKNEFMARKKGLTLVECRRKMLTYMKPLLGYLKLMNTIDPDSYKDAMALIDEAIEYVSTIAKSRQTRKEHQQVEEEDSSKTTVSEDTSTRSVA